MAKHNSCSGPGFIGPDGCWVPIAFPGGAIDGQSLIFNSNSPLQLAWGPIAKGDRGDPGPMGTPGRDGTNGTNGLNGLPGAPGRDGATGLQGPPGRDGVDGLNGLPGTNGHNGITPHIGANGNWFIGSFDTGQTTIPKDGKDGQNGRPGADGQPGLRGIQGIQGPPGKDLSVEVTLLQNKISELEARIVTLGG